MKRALILGGGGMLARELGPALERVGYSVQLSPRGACDITSAASVEELVAAARPTLVANCAAYTKVDKAEHEVDLAFAVNSTGAGNVARAAAKAGARLVHVSTDYVFDGRKAEPYAETDATAPMGAYARSKHAGEREVQAAGGEAYLVRTGELYGHGGPNFFDAILGRARKGLPLKVVSDQIVSPTWTRELARQLAVLVEKGKPGLYHATCSGAVSWFDAARKALALVGLEVPVAPVSTEEYGSPTPRPKYSVLAHLALEAQGLYCMRPWDVALAEWLASAPP